MINKGLFTNNSNEWETPKELFQKYDDIYHFTIDLASTKDNTKCERYYTKEDNSLLKDWSGETGWLNPPYGKEISLFVKKAYDTIMNNKNTTIVMLIPARTDTSYWHDYIFNNKYVKIEFLRGRVKFLCNGIRKQSAPFPSAIVIFSNKEVI